MSATPEDIGNVTRITASPWRRNRVSLAQITRGEVRQLLFDYNGAIDPARTIVSGRFECGQVYVVFMSNPVILTGARAMAVTIRGNFPLDCMIKALARLDNGEIYVQTVKIVVKDTYWFDGDTLQDNGPAVLVTP